MNARRAARLAWIVVSNGTLSLLGFRAALDTSADWDVRCVAGILAAALGLGVLLEAMKRRSAATWNIAAPSTTFAVMASSLWWLPALAEFQKSPYVGEAGEGAMFVAIFSLVPLLCAGITAVAYRVVDIEPDEGLSHLHINDWR